MDKFIELIAYYGVEWQQIAVENSRYSVVLAVLAILIGGFIVAILKRRKIVKLMRQVMQSRQQLEKAEQKHEELLIQQKSDTEQIASIQQQLEQASNTLQQEKEQHQSVLADKEQIFSKSADEQQQRFDALNSTLNEKSQLAERLQSDLDEQKPKIAQYEIAQAKIAEIENQAQQSANEVITVKQQLTTEVSSNIEQSKQLDKLKQSTQVQTERILELESQLEIINNSKVNEQKQQTEKLERERQQQGLEEIEAQRKQLEQEKLNEETNAKAELEQSIQQAAESKEETSVNIPPVDLPTKSTQKVEQKTVPTPSKKTDPQAKSAGMLNGVLGWFSSLDKAVAGDITETENTASNHQPEQQVTEPEAVETPLESVESKPVVEKKKIADKEVKSEEQGEDDFSEKLAEVADKMDSLQGKLTGFFKKKKP